MCNLIINADDFGYSKGVNLGIVEAYLEGVLTSTTLMVNMPGVLHAVECVKQCPNLGVGLHLNISLGYSLTKGKTLVDENNKFFKPTQLKDFDIYDEKEIYEEIKAQYLLFKEIMKKEPTHLDSHLFTSDIIPKMKNAAIRLASELNLPLRNHKIGSYQEVKFINYRNFNAKPDLNYIIEYFDEIIKDDFVEIMTHPGYLDLYLYKNSSYSIQRVEEVEFLKSLELKELIEKNKVKLINYSNIKK